MGYCPGLSLLAFYIGEAIYNGNLFAFWKSERIRNV